MQVDRGYGQVNIKSIQDTEYIKKLRDRKAEYKIDVLDSKGVPTTSVWIDEFGKTTGMSWTVGTKVKRGSGYRRAKVPKGTERGHIKSVNEGELDNAVEDSPLNVIPQTRAVNDPQMKAFETYRVKNCQERILIRYIIFYRPKPINGLKIGMTNLGLII